MLSKVGKEKLEGENEKVLDWVYFTKTCSGKVAGYIN